MYVTHVRMWWYMVDIWLNVQCASLKSYESVIKIKTAKKKHIKNLFVHKNSRWGWQILILSLNHCLFIISCQWPLWYTWFRIHKLKSLQLTIGMTFSPKLYIVLVAWRDLFSYINQKRHHDSASIPSPASVTVYLTVISTGITISSSSLRQWLMKSPIRLHSKCWVLCFLAQLSLSCKISDRFLHSWSLSKKALFQTPRCYMLSNDLVLSQPVRSEQ